MSINNLEIFDYPVCLVHGGTGSKLSVNKNVIDQLKTLDKPVVVVAIVGLYRTGKSYLMNRLAGKSRGFALGSTIQAKTKGIWIWVRGHPKNADQYLVLLDTEGLGDTEKGDPNHDNWLFCLATLLSSTLVYNCMGVIDDDALAKLNFVTVMSNHIRIKKDGTQEDEANFDCHFPHFVFALRDFSLDLEIDGEEVTATEYMEDCLALRHGSDKQAEQFNLPRRCIRKYFKYRSCFTFDRPCKTKLLKDLEKLDFKELNEDFEEEVEDFLAYIYSKSPAKKIAKGAELNGRMFSSLVETYVDAIANGALPCIDNAVVAMATIENSRNVEEVMTLYEKEMEGKLDLPTLDDKILAEIHYKCFKQSLNYFMSKVLCDSDNKFQKEFNQRIEARYKQFMKENEAASMTKCKALLEQLNAPIEKKLIGGEYAMSGGFAHYQNDVNHLQNQYQERKNMGVMSVQALLDFMKEKMKEGQSVLAGDKSVTEHEKKAEVERQKTLEAERARKAAERKNKLIEEMAAEREKARRDNFDRIRKQRQEENRQLQQHYKEIISLRMAERKRLMQERFEIHSEHLLIEISELRNNPPYIVEESSSDCSIL